MSISGLDNVTIVFCLYIVHFLNVKYFLFRVNNLRITKSWHTIRKE